MSAIEVLQLGPLDSPHMRQWCEAASAGGAQVTTAGHLRNGMKPAALADVCKEVRELPLPVVPSSRAAERRWGARGRRVLAAAQVAELPGWALWLRRLLGELEPDVVHAHFLDVWGAVAAIARARPLVVTAWGSDLYLRGGVRRRLGALATRDATAVTVPEPAMAAHIDRPVRHIDLGVDLERFAPLSAEQRVAAREELGLGSGPLVASFRAPAEVYRLDLVIDSFAELLRAFPDAVLAVAHGPLPLPTRISIRLDRLQASGRARILGSVPHAEMPRLLAAADVGISVPSSDGSPRSVWECLACGTPVVLSDLPRIRDRLGDDRGALYAPARATDLAAALAAAIGTPGPREAALARGRRWVATEADQSEHRRRLAALYAELTDPDPEKRPGVAARA